MDMKNGTTNTRNAAGSGGPVCRARATSCAAPGCAAPKKYNTTRRETKPSQNHTKKNLKVFHIRQHLHFAGLGV